MKKENQPENKKPGNGGNPNQIELNFIVNGEDVAVLANVNTPLKIAVKEALKESENVGQDPANWDVKLNGVILNQESKIKDLGLTSGTTLHLSPKTGAGG